MTDRPKKKRSKRKAAGKPSPKTVDATSDESHDATERMIDSLIEGLAALPMRDRLPMLEHVEQLPKMSPAKRRAIFTLTREAGT